MRLYIIRHGETDWNKERKLQGQADCKLNDFGRRLAYKTAAGLKNISFDRVFTSPLSRARDTAKIIVGKKKIPIIEDARIKEINFGEYEGKWCSEKAGYVEPQVKNFFHDPGKYEAPKQGETIEELINRVSEFLEEVCKTKEYEKETILISTHGAALRAMIDYLRQIPIERFWEGGVHPNCAVTIIEYMDNDFRIVEEGTVF